MGLFVYRCSMRVEGLSVVYGVSAEQWYEWYEPLSGSPKGVVALVHGGFWRQQHTLEQMQPLADFFLEQGWAVANIEYRRGDCGGDWPHIIQDVKTAFDSIRQRAEEKSIDGSVVGIGHSVGGQLVLLVADQQDVVVALAPVTDVARTAQEGLGESAAVDFFGAGLEQVAQEASPLHQLPQKQAQLFVIHGTDDQRVPLEHTQDYVRALEAAAIAFEFWKIPELDHFHIIDPSCCIWSRLISHLESL